MIGTISKGQMSLSPKVENQLLYEQVVLKNMNTIYKYYLFNTKKHCTRLSLRFPMSFQIISWRLILSFEFVAWLKLISGSFNLNSMFFFIQLLYHDFLPFFLLAILLSPFFMFDWLAADFWPQVSPLLSPFFSFFFPSNLVS